jgi:hypothetical protein
MNVFFFLVQTPFEVRLQWRTDEDFLIGSESVETKIYNTLHNI